MLKLEKTEVVGWEAAIRGMRNPMNSWDKSDSAYCHRDLVRDCVTCVHRDTGYSACNAGHFDVGLKDYDLMTHLRNAGTDHRKFMRMIIVYVDITAPLYWWKEFDTYKVGTVANSCSTMHKIADKEFTLDDFSHEHLTVLPLKALINTIDTINNCRSGYLAMKNRPTKELKKRNDDLKEIWWQMIQLLPSSYNQKRTVMLNYEVLANMYKSRKGHRLDEWKTLLDWIETLPYAELITGGK